MVKFDTSGNILGYAGTGYSPQIATADGGIIASTPSGTAITFDANLNVTGQMASLPTQSWTGGESGIAYQDGSIDQTVFTPAIIYATPAFASFAGTNQPGNGTSALCHDDRDKLITEYAKYGAGYLPVCFASEFVPSSNTNPAPDFSFSVLNQDDIDHNDYSDWAILKSSMLTGLEQILANYGQTITVKSGYRSPLVQHAISPQYPHDRHIHGDAVDIRTGNDFNTWKTLHDIARRLYSNACIEPHDSTYSHFHVDWRPWSQCAPAWRQ